MRLNRSIFSCWWLSLVVLSSCGADESKDSSPANEPDADWPPVTRISVRGTAEKPLQEGFSRLAANCEEWQDVPTLGPFNIQIPADWEVTKSSSGPREGAVSVYPIPRRSRRLTVHMTDQAGGTEPDHKRAADAQKVGEIDWSGEGVGIYANSGEYSAYIPVLSIVDYSDVYARLILGRSRNLKIDQFDRATVIRIFQSASLDKCAVLSYSERYANKEVIYVDEQ